MSPDSPENHESIHQLIRGLETDDLARQRDFSRRLIANGSRAVPALIEALRTGPPDVRKSSAYLLGALKDTQTLHVLCDTLRDDEPKVRQNSAVALGKLGDREAVPFLAEAARHERVGWVRASVFLALGALGGELSRQTLEQATPGEDAREREAYRKALDRLTTSEHCVDWVPEEARSLSFLVEAPEGLEDVAREEGAAQGLSLELDGPGMLSCPPSVDPGELLPRLRCTYGLLVDAGQGPPLSPEDPSPFVEGLTRIVPENPVLTGWREWLRSGDDRVRYRLSVEGVRLRRDRLRLHLTGVRQSLLPLQWNDSPSHYDVELILRSDEAASRLYVRPSFMKDHRFDYRVHDVGASIHPVVGACLARLARNETTAGGIVFDPTCGSGTLLVERAQLDRECRLTGLDVSPTSVRAARANIGTAGLSGRIRVSKGDAVRPENWPGCAEVLANLPFGMRTRHRAADIPSLYDAVVMNLAGHLCPGGRAILYTAAVKPLEVALQRHGEGLKVERHLRVRSGGLWANVWVVSAV
jgi:predicted RNA methylase